MHARTRTHTHTRRLIKDTARGFIEVGQQAAERKGWIRRTGGGNAGPGTAMLNCRDTFDVQGQSALKIPPNDNNGEGRIVDELLSSRHVVDFLPEMLFMQGHIPRTEMGNYCDLRLNSRPH